MNIESNYWEQTKQFYKEKFGIEPSLVEAAADFSVIKLTASGSSVESISIFLEIPKDVVEQVVLRNFGFAGWEENLPYNPLRVYSNLDKDSLEAFEKVMTERYGENDKYHLMYEMAIVVSKLERLIDDKWI